MLTARQNLAECLKKDGHPDRFVNQYEPFVLLSTPHALHETNPVKGGPDVVNSWGVTRSFPANVPGAFPVHTPEKVVIKDIEEWQKYVKAPTLDFPESEWEMFQAKYEAVDRTKSYATLMVAPGLFEQTHHLQGIDNALINYMLYPDEMHDLLKYLTDYELRLAELTCEKLHPDAVFHHDDWGSETNSFFRPEMFEEFFLEPYKAVYGYYKSHGVELIVHHSDSYAANLVPYMIEMGIDIWQGCMETNDVPGLVKKYQGQIAFMGGIDNKLVDFDGWTQEDAHKAAYRFMDACGMHSYIPCITQGGPGSVYPGTYDALIKEIQQYNYEHFGFTPEEQEAQAAPVVIMFGKVEDKGKK